MVRTVIWPAKAQQDLAAAYAYILSFSFQNAAKVKSAILASTRELAHHPERHPPDKYRKNNDGSFRAYELLHFRIAYKITDTQIIIVRVRHTSRAPKQY